jgi:hypothetical protein
VETAPRVDDDGPQWLAGTDPVRVDARSLAEFGAGLRTDLERNLSGQVQVISDKIAAAAGSTPAAVPAVAHARAMFDDHLADCLTGLKEHAAAAFRLAQIAEEVGKQYTNVDASAGARMDDVLSLLPSAGSGDSSGLRPGEAV